MRVPALARWLLALGIVAALAANLAHGWSDDPIRATVAAWPAACLVGSYELLLWLVRTAASDSVASEPAADLSLSAGWTVAAGRSGADDMHWASDNKAIGSSMANGAGVIGEDPEKDINVAAVTAYCTSIDSGRRLSERKLAARFGKTSRRWARSRMAEARQAGLLAIAGEGLVSGGLSGKAVATGAVSVM